MKFNYQKIIDRVKKSYTLEDVKIKFKFKELIGSAKTRWSPFIGYYVFFNPKRTEKMNYGELKGLVAHEVAHVYQEKLKNHNFFTKIIDRILLEFKEYLPSRYVINNCRKIEREADIIAIKKGFGKEVIAFKKFYLRNYSTERLNQMSKTYVSLEEAKRMINKNVKNKRS